MTDVVSRLSKSLADRYRIERELGAGGMATVYLAHDLKHDRDVAIKVLRAELAAVIGPERFLSEIKTTANLQHPHILSLFDSGTVDGTVFYVMPFVDGESLRDLLAREKQLPVDDALRIAREVADALQYAHAHGVIHRDIKPENILLQGGHALVADFGIALAAAKIGGTRMTETGMSLGTPQYMSPEQAMGERELDARTDVYALGCVTYEMLAGEPPFTGPTAQAIVARVITEEPRSLSLQRKTVPFHIEATVARALQKLPADRFATAAEFAAALANPNMTAAPRTSSLATPAAGDRSRRWLSLAPWLLALLAIGVGAWGWLSRPPSPGANWLSVTLGDSLGISSTGPSLAFSPDGRSLVFRDARAQTGILWVKRRDQLDPVPIPGTERASSPVFSPDGEWLAYTADGQVKSIRMSGGAAVTIADSAAPSLYGIAWLDDGTVIYASPSGDQLRRVSSAGGPSTIALADTTLRGFGLLNPTPLPHARGVLFAVCTSGCVTTSIHVGDLRTGTHKLLLNDAYMAWYLPIGYLLYVRRDGAALVAPFNLDRLEISGPAIPVLDDIMVVVGFPMLAWSPAGSLLYLRANGVSDAAEMVRVSREGAATPVDSSWFGGFNSFALSPDGKRVAVGEGLIAGGLSIWIKQLDRGPFSRLTFGGEDRRPTWSPDGRLVAFIRDSSNGNLGKVYVRRMDGSGADKLLAAIDRPVQEITWSGDGKWLVVRTDNGSAGAGDIVGVRTSGDTTQVPLVATSFTEMHPEVSRDGHWLAYTSNESGKNEIYVRPFPESSTGRWQVSTGGGSEPMWSPDGRELFFLDGATRLVAAQLRTTPAFEVVRLQPLFDALNFVVDPFHQSYDVAPDGRSFLFTRRRSSGRASATLRAVLVENWFADLRARLKR